MSRDVMKEALRGLRRKSLEASRKGGQDRALLIAIGMADEEEEPEGESEGETDDKTRRKR